MMFVDSVVFERIVDPPPLFESYVMRVLLFGGEYEVRSAPLVVMVGDLNVEMLVPMFGEEGIVGVQGMLEEIPPAGSEVKVGYADGPLIGTGLEFSRLPDA